MLFVTLQKNGFVKVAHILENELWDGKFWDSVIYSILKKVTSILYLV